jgi:hypothetical protein
MITGDATQWTFKTEMLWVSKNKKEKESSLKNETALFLNYHTI